VSEHDVSIRIGDLLEKAGLVTTGDLTEAVAVSKRLNMPIGRVLIMSGCVTERLLKAAIEAQSMVRDKLVSLDTAVESLGKVSTNNISFQEAVRKTDPTHVAGSSTNKLGEILIEFGVIDQTQLKSALVRSIETGMQLGATLVSMNYLAPTLLPVILHLQDQIRNSVITRAEARAEFESAFAMYKKAKDSFKRGADDNELQSQQQVAAAMSQQQAARNYHAEFFNQQQAPALPQYQQAPAQPPYPPQPYPQPGQPYPGMPPGAVPPGWAAQFPGYPPQWGSGYPAPPPQPNPYMQQPNAGWPPPYPPADPNGGYTPSGPMPPVGWPGQQQMPPAQPPQAQAPPPPQVHPSQIHPAQVQQAQSQQAQIQQAQIHPAQVQQAQSQQAQIHPAQVQQAQNQQEQVYPAPAPPAQPQPNSQSLNQQSMASATISLPPGEIQAARVAEGLMPPAVSGQSTPAFEKLISRQLKQQQGSPDQPVEVGHPSHAPAEGGMGVAHAYSETDTVPDLPVIRMVSKAYQEAFNAQQQSQVAEPIKPSSEPWQLERKEKITDTAQDLPVIRFESHLADEDESPDSQATQAEKSEAEITLSDFTFEIPGFGQSHKAHTEPVQMPDVEATPTTGASTSPFDIASQLESNFQVPQPVPKEPVISLEQNAMPEDQKITFEMPMGPVPQIKGGRRTFSDLPSSQQQNPFAQSANPFAPPTAPAPTPKPNPLAPATPPPLQQDRIEAAPIVQPNLFAPPPPSFTPTQADPTPPAQTDPTPSSPFVLHESPFVQHETPVLQRETPVAPPEPSFSTPAPMDTVTATNPAVIDGKAKKSSPFSALVSGKNEVEPTKPRRSRTRIPAAQSDIAASEPSHSLAPHTESAPSEPAPAINTLAAETITPADVAEKSDLVLPIKQAYAQAKTPKEPRKSRNRMRAFGASTHNDVPVAEQTPTAPVTNESVTPTISVPVPTAPHAEMPNAEIPVENVPLETPFIESTKTLELKPIMGAEVASSKALPTDAAPEDLAQQSEFFAELAKVISPRRRGKNSRVAAEPTTTSTSGGSGGNGHGPSTLPPTSEAHTEKAEQHSPPIEVDAETGVHEVIDVHTGKTSKKSKSKKGSKSSCGELTNPFELLKLAGYFTSADVQTAFSTALNDPVAVPGLLMVLGLVDAKVIEQTNACQSMLRSGKLKPQQAAFILSSVRGGKSFDEALEELGIKPILTV